MGISKRLLMLAGVVCVLSATPAFSALINYGNFVGDTVDFLQVQEDSTTDPIPLYGAPVASNDSLDFNPVGFAATAISPGGGFDLTDGTLSMYVDAHDGQAISEFNIIEAGDYTLAGPGGAGTWVKVFAPVFIKILEINDVGVSPLSINSQLTFAPSGGDYFLPGDAGSAIWSGSLSVDLDAYLASQNIAGQVTKISVQMDNQLMAFNEAGSIAFIKKKDVGGFAITVNQDIPEPSALAFLALAGVGLLRRR